MSNPFATFRKNQNYWMAGLVLLSILAFVVAPAIMQIQESLTGGSGGGAVVVRWNGGQLTVADMQNAVQKHGSLVRFLNDLAQEVVQAGGEPRVPGFFYDHESKQVQRLGIETNSDEESIARTRILSDKAKRLGIEFSDDAVDEFILAFCDGRVATARIAEILRESSGGRLSNFDVREQLKHELASMVVRSTAASGFYATAPGEIYQDFLKLNRTAKVEAFPVFVADYMDKVQGQPSELEIETIFDLGSMQLANPNSADPGFVQPYQADFEYVESNIQQWVEREKSKLTEDQLRAEYDRMVELEQLKVPVDSKPAANKPADTPDTETPDTETPASGDADANSVPTATEPAVEPAAPASENNEPASAEPATPATTPAADPAPASESNSGSELNLDPPAPASGDGSALPATRLTNKVRLVSAPQDESAAPPPVEQPPQLSAENADDVAPATENAATENAATENAAATTTGSTATDSAEEDAATASSGEAATREMRTQTFEEAREQIADSLARAKAIPAHEAALTNVSEKVMKPYYGAYRQYAAFRDADLAAGTKKVAEPQRPNLKKLAEEAGLVYGQTGLTDGFKLVQTQFGKSAIRQEELGLNGAVAKAAMSPQLPLFQPMQSSYFDQETLQQGRMPEFFQYIFWKTAERPIQIPQLSDVRAQVVDYWKRLQARKLAEAAAAALAKKVSPTADAPWKDALSTAEQSLVVETDPFSWITRMGDYNMPTNVNKLEQVGNEFMQAVFSAQPGSVTVAPTENKSIYYVVRIVDYSPAEAELQQRFDADPDKRGPLSIAQEESNQLVQDWYQNLYDELGVKFEIPLNQL
ncbi:MAG: hypothetical protein R3C09_11725 [Pirellulaceae bacterium]